MANHPNRSKKKYRPLELLQKIERRYPTAWQRYDQIRQGRGRVFPDWPPWCYCPIKVADTVIGSDQNTDIELQIVNSLAAWRLTQGIYDFDYDLAVAIINTPIKELPVDVFYCLPEWCVYIDLSKMSLTEKDLAGFFVYLEYDADLNRSELRFLLDYVDNEITGLSIPLDRPTIDAMFFPDKLPLNTAAIAKSLLGLTLYLCAINADYGDRPPPTFPRPKRTKQGWRLFAPDRPTIWNVGLHTGAKLRVVNDRETHPQIDPAHWHTAYVDAEKTELVLEWLPFMR